MTKHNDNDVAIVGLALRVPGAVSPEQFWQNLIRGVESLSMYTEEELLQRGISRAELADPAYVRAGMPLDHMEAFDPEFFGFSPKEAAILDPQHRHFYEVAWEALERAGHPPSKFNGTTGVFGGSGMAAYFARNILSNHELVDSVGLFLLRHTGNDKDFLATRVSYAFDLKGPAINVQTACSTSLVATHLAVQSLLAGECDMALAGGVTIELPHRVGYHFKEGEILSPDGHCRPFDHRSRGTVFGSGCGVVVLRRLADALADGDHIHAVIKGTAVNNDGAGKVGYLAPSVDGQAAAITEALAVAGIEADSVSYVECHGTGTPVGDPIEVAAMTRAFRAFTDRTAFCRIGSVKSNIGHTDTAAGVLGLIKTALALEHGQIPPSLGYEAPNPAIPFADSPFKVAAQLETWPRTGGLRRAGVNSLGVGGTNAFAVLEEAPQTARPAVAPNPQLLVLSARSRRALDDAGTRLADWLENSPQAGLADVAYTLLEGRHTFEHRRVLAVESSAEAVRMLREPDAQRVFTHSQGLARPSLVFMYPGGGAQYFQMSRGLYDSEPVFRENVDRGLRLLGSRFGVELGDVFLASADRQADVTEQLARPSVQLPLIFLVEIALTRLWESYGVVPAVLIGHSLGENAAACIAGVMSFEDALGLVLLRGQLMDAVPAGAMLSVSMPADELRAELGDALDLAAANSPQLSVASGPEDKIAALETRLQARGIDAKRVRINIAAHSRLLDVVLERFGNYLSGIRLHAPKLPIISNRTGDWLTAAQAQSPGYWVEHLRNSVLFGAGIDTVLHSADRVFLEVGPGHTLGALARQNPAATAQHVLASLRHPEDPVSDAVYFRTIIGRLWAVGVTAATSHLWPTQPRRIPLPTYPFQHSPYWIEAGQGTSRSPPNETRPLRQENFAEWFRMPRWVQQGIVEPESVPHTWLVFLGSEPVGQALADHLRNAGHTVVTVQAGDTFSRHDAHQFSLAPEAGGVGYQELVEALGEDGLLPDRILHTWLLTWNRSFRPGSTFFHRNQEYGFYSLFHLAQALGKAGHDNGAMHWLVLANGSQRVGDEKLPCPDKATALGPCAVIPREFAGFSCRFVDIELPQPPGGKRQRSITPAADVKPVVEALRDELEAPAGNEVVAWRNGVRWQRHLGPWKAQPEFESATRLRNKGVYLLTGGLGGIAGIVAEWLITHYSARVALLSRTPLPDRADWDDWLHRHGPDDNISRAIERVRHLESLGGEVLPLTGDVTVAERMQDVLTEIEARLGPINGVFHTAGLIRDNLIQLKSQRDIEDVFAAKVYGTSVLDEVFGSRPLDFMVLFSSNSAFVAPQGQVDYVAANSFLNAWADARKGDRPYPVIAVNWGIWKQVGMVAADAATPPASHPVRYPLFRQRISHREGVWKVHTLQGELSAQAHWVVDDHRLGTGEALLSGTGYIEVLRAALSECGIDAPWELTNLVFAAPLFVSDDRPRAFEVRLRGGDRDWQGEVVARLPNGDWVSCATARIRPAHKAVQDVLPVTDIRSRCTQSREAAGGSSALRTRQEDHLRFGPRWRVLKQLDLGQDEAIAQLALADPLSADVREYPLHPALLDIATGCAMNLIPGYGTDEVARNLWAPLSYKRFHYRAALPPSLLSWVRLNPATQAADGFAVFDVTLATLDGEVLARVEQLTLRRLDGPLQAPRDMAEAVITTAEGATLDQPRKKPQSPGELSLAHNITQGIEAEEGTAALLRILSTTDTPSTVVVSSLAIPSLLRQAEAISQSASRTDDTRFSRPELESDFEAPRNDTECAMAELWGKLLGVDGVGVHDSFFDLGGHSLIAVRLFNEISDRYGVDLPMSVLMQSPTVAALARRIQDETGTTEDPVAAETAGKRLNVREKAFQYVVPMHAGPVADGTPLFMVAGMFGNVLNLSHMAHLLGEERPFYALQARGLYGNAEPHDTFEAMAADYLEEVRRVQPEGPYLLGGFSGGGIVAWEMARQLLESGDRVLQVILLDTPITAPSPLSVLDRVQMALHGLRNGGLSFLVQRVRDRLDWEQRKRAVDHGTPSFTDSDTGTFQSQRIGAAFVRAVDSYSMPRLPVQVALFRPKLDVRFAFRDGRRINADRRYVAEDNLWTPYVAGLSVTEVPGNHDNMVLEPNVRVLVAAMQKGISRTERA